MPYSYKRSNSFSYGHYFSTYGPTNSVAFPECLSNDPFPSLTATATYGLLTLLLLLNLFGGTLSWHLRNHECEAINCTPNHTRYGVLSKRYPVRGTRYEIRDTGCKVRGARWEVRGTGYGACGTRYEVRGTGYMVQVTQGHK